MRFYVVGFRFVNWMLSLSKAVLSVVSMSCLLLAGTVHAEQKKPAVTEQAKQPAALIEDDGKSATHQLSQLIAETNFAEGSSLSASAVRLRNLEKLRFTATVVEPLKAAKTQYMQHSLQRLRPEFTADIGHVIQVADSEGNPVFLYVLAELAPTMQPLKANDQLLLTGYHVFDSRHGPGILISAFVQR